MNSFYGGKQGRTYHIVARYDCVNIESFEQEYLEFYNENNGTEITVIPTFDSSQSYVIGDVFRNSQDSETIYYLVTNDFSGENYLNNTVKIKAMVQEFQKGGSYTEVNYGQYVIIDTIKNRNHKSDLENGLLFRRGFDYNQTDFLSKPNPKDQIFWDISYNANQEEIRTFKKLVWQAAWSAWVENVGGGAIYEGQIVGPQGDAPELFPIKWEILKEKDNTQIKEVVPVSETVGFKWEYDIKEWQYDPQYPEGSQGAEEHKIPIYWSQNDEGYEAHRTKIYDDSIKVATVTLKDSDSNVIGAEIAFDIPEPTIKVSAQTVDAYGDTPRIHKDQASEILDQNLEIEVHRDKNNKIINYSNLIHQHSATGKEAVNEYGESTPHPFYLNYDIAIPKGIHGNNLENIQTINGQTIFNGTNDWIYEVKEWQYEDGWDDTMEGYEEHRIPSTYWTEEDEGFEDHRYVLDGENKEIKSEDQYITFSIRNFDVQANGDIIEPYAGRLPFRVIDKIITNYGIRTFINQEINEPTEIESEIGSLYHYENSDYYAICIQTGTFTVENNLNEFFEKNGQIPIEGTIIGDNIVSKWRVVKLSQSPPPYSLEIDYKAGENSPPIDTHFIDYFYMDDYGYVHVVYANPNSNLEDRDHILGFLNSISNVSYDFGEFRFQFTNGTIRSFNVNTILDIKRVGDNLAVLYSDQNAMREERNAAESDQNNNTIYLDLHYDKDANLNQTRIYKVLANDAGRYHIQGDYKLLDLVQYINPLTQQVEHGRLFYGIENMQPFEIPVMPQDYEGTQEQWEQDWKAKWKESIKERAGWLVSIRDIIDNEEVITLYAYDYNTSNYEKEDGHFKPPYIINSVSYEIENSEPIILSDCATYWYPVQSIALSSIDPSFIFVVDKKKSSGFLRPQTDTKHTNLNIGGAWFEITTGHDEAF